jgi:hypothetical protein
MIKDIRRNDEPCEENNKKQLACCFFQFPWGMGKSKTKNPYLKNN